MALCPSTHDVESLLERAWRWGLQHTSDSNRDLAAARQRHSEAMARELEDARARARNSELELAKKEAGHGREVRGCCQEIPRFM